LTALTALVLASAQGSPSSPAQNAKKPLSGYSVITVETFVVGTLAAKMGFPQGFEGLIQKSAVVELSGRKLFEKVIDATEPTAGTDGAATAPEEERRRLILSGTIIGYDPGSRATRVLVGFGAGSAKVKVRLILRDAQTSKEVLRTDLQGKYAGMSSFAGGTVETATRQAAEKVVKGLIKEIQKNR